MLIGHQAWRDAPRGARTLADLWPEEPRAVIVGLNPSPVSVEAGHYYQGPVGRRQMSRLRDAGLFGPVEDIRRADDVAFAQGIAFTDVVKTPSSRATGLSRAEIAAARGPLVEKLRARRVPLVVSVFSYAADALVGGKSVVGFQPETTDWGARVFRMPSPYAPLAEVGRVMGALAAHLAGR